MKNEKIPTEKPMAEKPPDNDHVPGATPASVLINIWFNGFPFSADSPKVAIKNPSEKKVK